MNQDTQNPERTDAREKQEPARDVERRIALLDRVHKGGDRLPATMRHHRAFVRLLRRHVNDKEFMNALYRLRDSVIRKTLRIREDDRGLVIAMTGKSRHCVT